MMAKIDVMDRKEMRKIKDALHIDVRDGKLYVWGMFNQTVCIYPEEISAYDPENPQTTGTFTVRLPDTPPSPPAVCNPKCDKCGKPGADYSVDGDGSTWWYHDSCRPKPAEMPEVAPEAIANKEQPSPMIYGRCIAFYQSGVDKKANSCDGCKIAGCAAKGRTS